VWAACTSANCDSCKSDSSTATTFCTRSCDDKDQCNGGSCLGSDGIYFCERPCAGCNTACSYTSDYSIAYCECTTCATLSAPRPLGVSCSSDSSCASGTCYEIDAKISSGWSTSSTTVASLCTQKCTSNADCGDSNLVCAFIPCAPGQTDHCEFLCITPCGGDNSCEQGNCKMGTSPEGATVPVCDLRTLDGGSCVKAGDCTSGRCTSNVCVPEAGASNGTDCATAVDCASKTCTNGKCRGSSLIGDACTSSYDCSVGGCCGTGKCGTGC
jgi:hypothetical protein